MKNYRYIAAMITAAGLTFNISADEQLTKEIVVEKDYVPVERQATKVSTSPSMVKIEATESDLSFSNWNRAIETGNTIPTMSPYGYKTARKFGTSRGYLDFAIGSYWNIDASAGYRLIDTEKSGLNIWLHHTSTWGMRNRIPLKVDLGMGETEYDDVHRRKFVDDVIGIDYSRRFGQNTFTAGAFYHFARNNYRFINPEMLTLNENPILSDLTNTNQYGLNARFEGRTYDNEITYEIGAKYSEFTQHLHTTNKGEMPAADEERHRRVKENHLEIDGNVSKQWGDNSTIGLTVSGEYLGYKRYDLGKIRLTPQYILRGEKMTFKAGVNVDLSFNNGSVFRISPDVYFDAKLLRGVKFFANATGGKYYNTNADLFRLNCYSTPETVFLKGPDDDGDYDGSYTPADITAGLAFGSFGGFKAKFHIGYAKTEDALNVECQRLGYMVTTAGQVVKGIPDVYGTSYTHYDVSGFYFGGEMSYSYRNIINVSVEGKYSKQDGDKGYSFGFDRPEYVVGASLEVVPMEQLRVNVGYELRGNRGVWYERVVDLAAGVNVWESISMKNVNNLSFRADYQINEMIGVNVRLNNILNKNWEEIQNYRAQGFAVMAGVGLKF